MANPCDFYIHGKKMKMDEFLSYIKKMPHSELNEILGSIPSFKNIPEAPFISDTNAYVKLGLKTALKEAVKQGADKIAWTTGEQQNDRYDLSKQVDRITVSKPNEDGITRGYYHRLNIIEKGGQKTQLAVDKNGKVIEAPSTLYGKPLEDVVGKEMAEKIMSVKQGGLKEFSGLDLQIGGKGMKGFYGSPAEGSLGIVGNVAKSLFKQEPKTTKLNTDSPLKRDVDVRKTEDGKWYVYEENNEMDALSPYFETKQEAEKYLPKVIEQKKSSTQHSIDITPELKAEVESGLPLFKDIKGRSKEIADYLRSLRASNDKAYDALLGIPVAVYNGMLSTIAAVIEGGGTILQAIDDAVEYIKANTKLTDTEEIRSEVEKHLTKIGVMESNIPQIKEEKTRADKESGFERVQGQTSFSKRAFEGTEDVELQKKIASYGFDYAITGYDIAEKTARQIINEIGLERSLEMVEDGSIDGAEATIIRATMIDVIGQKIVAATSNKEREDLSNLEARLINSFSRIFTKKGQEIAVLKDVYERADFTYKLSFQLQQYASVNNGIVPEEIKAKFEQLNKQIEEQKAKITELEKQKSEKEAQETFELIKKRTKPQQKKIISDEQIDKIAEFLRKGKISKPGIFMASSPASIVWDSAIEVSISALYATKDLVNAIAKGIEKIKESDWYKGLNSNQKKEAEKSFINYINSIQKSSENVQQKPKIVKGKIVIPDDLIRDLVESGIDNINDLVKSIKQIISEDYPDIEDRVIRDAITRYGRVLKMSQDEISKTVRKLKRIGRILSALEDISDKKRPLRSGLQRDKIDAEERVLQKRLREEMKELPTDEETESRELKTALDGIKTRLRNSIEDLEREIATGEKRAVVSKDINYDEEANDLKDRRDALRSIRDEMFGEDISDEVRLSRMIKATQNQIDKLEKQISEKDIEIREKKSITNEELEAKRKNRELLKKELQQLREDAGIINQQRIKSAVNRTKLQIIEFERRLKEGDFESKKTKTLLESDELTKERAKLIAIKEQYASEHYKNELRNRTTAQKWRDGLIELWGLPRTLMATGELSFILIQGGVPTIYNLVRNPSIVIEGIKKMILSMAKESNFHKYEQLTKAQPFYQIVKGSKLALSEYDAKLTAREELGAAGWANTIWDWLMIPSKFVSQSAYEFLKRINPLKIIERGGVAYMNHMRLMQFLNGMDKLQRQGKTFEKNTEDFKNLADVINTFSGRAKLPYNTEASAKALSLLFFSPRNWYSVIIQTTPLFFYYMKNWGGKNGNILKPSVAQKLAMQQYMVYMGITIGSVLAVAAYLNNDDDDENEVSFDPKSTDFMKIKLGNTRIDPFGGRQQMIVYQIRMMLDIIGYQSYTNSRGESSRMGEGFTPTKFDITWRLFQNKMAPTLSQLTQYTQTKLRTIDGEDKRYTMYGEEYKPLDKLAESGTPIFWQTIPELYKEHPDTVATFMSALAALGISINSYEKKETLNKTKKPKTTLGTIKSINSGTFKKIKTFK